LTGIAGGIDGKLTSGVVSIGIIGCGGCG